MADNSRAEIAKIYIAFFDRAPDPEGLAFWEAEYQAALNGGAEPYNILENIANSFALSAEAQALYPTVDNPDADDIEDFITNAYQNMFHRLPDADGLAYWTARVQEELDAGRPIGSVLIDLQSGAQNTGAGQDLTTLENKVIIALEYVEAYEEAGVDWTPGNDRSGAVEVLDDVGSDPATLEEARDKITEIVDEQTTPGGGNPTEKQMAIEAINNAETAADVTAALTTYKSVLFDADTAALFDEMPAGGGRQQAVAAGILEVDTLFGDYANFAVLKAQVENQVDIEHGKFEFITAVDGATTVDEMVAALQLAKGLDADRAALIEDWANSGVPAAEERAEALQYDSYTQAMHDIADDSAPEMAFLAAQLLDAKAERGEPFYGTTNIIEAYQAAEDAQDLLSIDQGDFATDRYEPTSAVYDEGQLSIVVDPAGPTESGVFERYQGVVMTDDGSNFDVAGTALLSVTMAIDSAWLTDDSAQMAGVWVVLQNEAAPSSPYYSIVEFFDAQAAEAAGIEVDDDFTAGFRFWSDDGWNAMIDLNEADIADGEVELSYVFSEGAHIWFIDGVEVYRDLEVNVDEAVEIDQVIFNARNFGGEQTYEFSDISLVGTAPEIPA